MAIAMKEWTGPEEISAGVRASRVRLKTPVMFDFPGGRAWGESIDISESGILAVFTQMLDIWLIGRLSILVGEQPIDIEARVARVDGRTAGLSFRQASDKQHAIIRDLINKASE
jgi:hypothetical protein